MRNINYDEKVLAGVVGGDIPALTGTIDQMTARTLTDSTPFRGSTPETRFSNARCWLQRAYDEGKEAGKYEERADWKAKIARLFGL